MDNFNYDSWIEYEDSVNADKSRYERKQQEELIKEDLSEEF